MISTRSLTVVASSSRCAIVGFIAPPSLPQLRTAHFGQHNVISARTARTTSQRTQSSRPPRHHRLNLPDLLHRHFEVILRQHRQVRKLPHFQQAGFFSREREPRAVLRVHAQCVFAGGGSSGPRSAAPPTVFPSSIQRSATQALYEATRWASAPTWTPMVRALLMRGRRFIASAPASALPGPSAYVRDDHRDQLKVEEGISRV